MPLVNIGLTILTMNGLIVFRLKVSGVRASRLKVTGLRTTGQLFKKVNCPYLNRSFYHLFIILKIVFEKGSLQ